MDLQSRLGESRGAVTSEAALGIAALVMTTMMLFQAIAVAVQYVQLLGLAHHASDIASASGDPMTRASQAESFVLHHDPVLGIIVSPHQTDVTVSLAKSISTLLPWNPELQVSSTSSYVDEVLE